MFVITSSKGNLESRNGFDDRNNCDNCARRLINLSVAPLYTLSQRANARARQLKRLASLLECGHKPSMFRISRLALRARTYRRTHALIRAHTFARTQASRAFANEKVVHRSTGLLAWTKSRCEVEGGGGELCLSSPYAACGARASANKQTSPHANPIRSSPALQAATLRACPGTTAAAAATQRGEPSRCCYVFDFVAMHDSISLGCLACFPPSISLYSLSTNR